MRLNLPSWAGTLALKALVLMWVVVGGAVTGVGQVSPVGSEAGALPDAPSMMGASSSLDEQAQGQNPGQSKADPDGGPVQTKRIAGIMPNFRSVSADVVLPPQTAKEKFLIAGRDTFDYSSFFIASIQAGFAMDSASYPEFHQGVKGYARYYWHTLADTVDENFMVGGAMPALFHQDNRFYTLGHGRFVHRATYAASRVVFTRGDSGNQQINFSEVVGAGAAAGISSTYYPTKYQTWTKVGQKWLTSMVIDSASFTFKEFWPNINDKLFQSRRHHQAASDASDQARR